MDSSKDYYGILGILPTAEDIVIRAAYKALVQRYHPDRADNQAKANETIKELNEAYAVLSDPKSRKEYDDLVGDQFQADQSTFAEDVSNTAPVAGGFKLIYRIFKEKKIFWPWPILGLIAGLGIASKYIFQIIEFL